jgi:hypothetical protein
LRHALAGASHPDAATGDTSLMQAPNIGRDRRMVRGTTA